VWVVAFPTNSFQFILQCDLSRGVAKKTRRDGQRLAELEPKLLRKCRTICPSAWICRQAVSLREKPVAIGSVDSEDRPSVAR
jgi:hypothetical protein